MVNPKQASIDPEAKAALREKYLLERDKRLRTDGNNQYVEIKHGFEQFLTDPHTPITERASVTDHVTFTFIGGGFAGLVTGARLKEQGITDVRVVEKGGDFGGTWYWNRYPGARCDSESHTYNFTFSKEIFENWSWPERYSKQDVILEYLNYVVEKLSLKKDMLFDNKVIKAHFDEKSSLWNIKTDKDKTFSCKYLISAVGCLSAANIPKINGLNKFKGNWYHTGKWPHTGVDFKNKRVAQIGVGSTGIQLAPEIAKSAKKLSIFQRSPNFSICLLYTSDAADE